jgi:vanillate O-demethylase ferredoxin subunit
MNSFSLKVRVARKRVEAIDICSFELVSGDGQPLPAFSAGSHVDVLTPSGLTHQYSLCNNPSESHRYLLGVLNDPRSRGGSRSMHESPTEGDVIEINMPKNHFALAHEATRDLLVAGDVGITPILCMADRLATGSAAFELHYCTRSPERTAFKQWIDDASFSRHVHFHFDNGPVGQRLDLARLFVRPEDGTHVYVCGPGGSSMQSSVRRASTAGQIRNCNMSFSLPRRRSPARTLASKCSLRARAESLSCRGRKPSFRRLQKQTSSSRPHVSRACVAPA